LKKELHKYCVKILKRFHKRFKTACKNPESEDAIHDLRTSIKRIKACLKFIKDVDKDFKYKKLYKGWKQLFNEIGNYRDIQVMLSHIKKLLGHTNQFSPYSIYMQTAYIQEFKKHFREEFYQKIIQRAGHSVEHISMKKQSEKYCNKKIKKANSIIAKQPVERETKLHILRKLLKELQYNIAFLKKAPKLRNHLKKMEHVLDKLTDLLGDWHDNKNLSTELANAKPAIAFVKDSGKVKAKLRLALQKEKNVLEGRVNAELRKDVVYFVPKP
jgi:CHAD domain-containing protein